MLAAALLLDRRIHRAKVKCAKDVFMLGGWQILCRTLVKFFKLSRR